MRRIITATLFLALVFAFAACNDDKNDGDTSSIATVSGTIAGMPAGSDYEVRLICYVEGGDDEVMATAKVSGGSFSLALPATVGSSFLRPITDLNVETGSNLTFSDDEAKVLPEAGLELYQGDKYIDDILFGKFDIDIVAQKASIIGGLLIYSDRDVKITGAAVMDDDLTGSVNVNLKKGWNWSFRVLNINGESVSAEMTTKGQPGMYLFLEDAIDF